MSSTEYFRLALAANLGQSEITALRCKYPIDIG